ncbi:TMEM175 family protein [Microbacterium sp. cf046]|uniref:TMEM175 family protein n=1 Tax=Microbacterium sp. cf046 TaxID=1761803 RepID=UPI001C31B9C5|nr:TMEM175 family protein [Microbacterium sp. cf046]
MAERVPTDPEGRSRELPRSGSESFASQDSNEFGRGISFLDAIYGFAATLLIANVDAPPAAAWESMDALAASSVPAQALGFALSFTVIAVFWRVNVRLTRRLRGLDAVTTFINMVGAGLVILIAYTTQGISDPSTADLALPTAFYAANIAAVALCQTAMFQVARARGLERTPSSSRDNLLDAAGALVTPVVFLVSIPIALTWGASAGKWTWAAAIVLGPLVGVLVARAGRRVKV